MSADEKIYVDATQPAPTLHSSNPRATPTRDGGAGAVLRGVGQACAGNSEVLRLMTKVFHLVQPLSVLQQEPLRGRVLSRFAS